METLIPKGKNILYGTIIAIVILQLMTNVIDNTPLLHSLIRFSLLFIVFSFLSKGYPWSKWILSIYLILVGIGGIRNSWFLITNKNILPNNLIIGILAGLTGVSYIFIAILVHILNEIKIYLTQQRESINKITVREHFANFFFSVGIAVIICVEAEMLNIAVKNIISQPKLIIGGVIFLPLKLFLYAVPGLIIIFIGTLINKGKRGRP